MATAAPEPPLPAADPAKRARRSTLYAFTAFGDGTGFSVKVVHSSPSEHRSLIRASRTHTQAIETGAVGLKHLSTTN
jgi:hypothetical protein